MYIRTYDQYPESSPDLNMVKKSNNNTNLAKTTRSGQHLKNMILRTSLSKYPKSPIKYSQQNQQIKVNSNFYQSAHAGSYLKNNRIRQVKTKHKARQRAKEKIKQQLLGLLQQNESNYICKQGNQKRIGENKRDYRKHFSITGIQVSPQDKFKIGSTCSSDKMNLKQRNSSTVLDLAKLYRIANNGRKSSAQKYNDYVSQIYCKYQKWKQLQENTHLKPVEGRRSLSSCRRRTHFSQVKPKLVNTEFSINKQYVAKVGQHINPWAINKFEEDQQLIF